MQTIDRATLIERLTELQPYDTVARTVDRALHSLGWAERREFSGAEVIALGTRMAEQARVELESSASPADREAAAELSPLVDALRDDLLPELYPESERSA